MFYPLFLAAVSLVGIPLKTAEQILYLVISASASVYLGRQGGRRSLGTALFVALAFNPESWDFRVNRVIREGLYVSPTFAVVMAVIGLCFHRGRVVNRLLLAAGAGLLFGAFWLTLEEGPWIIPALACPVVIATFAALAQAGSGAQRMRRLGPLALSIAVALLVFSGSLQAVMAVNGRIYGEAVTTEFRSASFTRAYGALAGIRQDHWERYIVVPRDARVRAYAASPAARQLEPYFEGQGGRCWSRIGCDSNLIPLDSSRHLIGLVHVGPAGCRHSDRAGRHGPRCPAFLHPAGGGDRRRVRHGSALVRRVPPGDLGAAIPVALPCRHGPARNHAVQDRVYRRRGKPGGRAEAGHARAVDDVP